MIVSGGGALSVEHSYPTACPDCGRMRQVDFEAGKAPRCYCAHCEPFYLRDAALRRLERRLEALAARVLAIEEGR